MKTKIVVVVRSGVIQNVYANRRAEDVEIYIYDGDDEKTKATLFDPDVDDEEVDALIDE